MSYDLNSELEKTTQIIELLEQELRGANQGLEQDLENAIMQMHMNFLEERI